MTDEQKIEVIRNQRGRHFKYFDAVAIKYLSQGLDIPADWLTYAEALRNLTEDVDSTTRITEGLLDIIWPEKPKEAE